MTGRGERSGAREPGDLGAELAAELAALEDAGLLRRLPDTPSGLVDWTSNDVLDLATDPRLVDAARAATAADGAGGRAARLLGGTPGARALEREAAARLGAEAALLFPSGYQANAGLLTTLVGPGDALFSDRLNHASLIDGARLTRARVDVFAHLDLVDLDRRLARAADARRRLVVVEGVFSMDGDAAPVGALLELCARHDAWLVVDEAHATGLVGPGGRGAAAAQADHPRLAARTVTGGKALGAGGALVVGSAALCELAANRARSFVFTTAPPPALVGALGAGLAAALDEAGEERRARARAVALRLADELGLPAPAGAIVPIPVGDPARAVASAAVLAERGHDLRAVRPPTVPAGTSRLRVVARAGHRDEELDALVAILRELDLPVGPASRTTGPGPRDDGPAPDGTDDEGVSAGDAPAAGPGHGGDATGRDVVATPPPVDGDGHAITPALPPPPRPLSPALFVAGTDTDAGKTVAAATLVRALELATRREVHYWKPVQTGDDSDSATVADLAGLPRHRIQRPAIELPLPASPHEAAADAGRALDPRPVWDGLGGLRRVLAPDPLVVELAGGLLVPYTDPAPGAPPVTQLDWLAEERAPIALVARSGLGTLNHTMLSLAALRARHLVPRVLVLVGEHHASNLATLAAWGEVPVLELPRLEPLDPGTVDAIARQWAVGAPELLESLLV